MTAQLDSARPLALALATLALWSPAASAQRAAPAAAAATAMSKVDTSLLTALKWREIGPMRGGRSVAVAGSSSRPFEYWMGTTGGGVMKTTDGGITWVPVTDKYFGGTIGAIGVAESNPDIVYVGAGEYPIRGNVSHGDGVFKTVDGGKTWASVGLVDTRQISRVRVHPTNPDIAYVGAQGHFAGPNAERGVFKTTDGGKTWRKVLFRNDSTGITDLVMDPKDPNTLYAAFWQSYRNSWTMVSGGKGSGIFKTTDGGETWRELSANPGLPKGILGNIGLAVSAANPQRVWALIEAEDGGVYRSDDGGATWTRTNAERKLLQRAWYYARIFADPKNPNTVYALNTGLYRSTDEGKTFRSIPDPHGDNHDLWIAPNDPNRMINSNDGGANVSFNGGRSWSEQDFPTAQFYHVTTTMDFPYKVCGAQQDNSTVCIDSRAQGGIGFTNWEPVGGGESGYIAVRPDSTNIIYAGSYGGDLTRFNSRTGLTTTINPWPDNPMGYSSEDIKYRFQWTYPIVISPHDPKTLYVTANVVFKSRDDGRSFQIISPDLTRHDPKTMGPSGGPITKDQTGVETYATIFTLAESPKAAGTIWTGSDDGLVYLTRDGGKSWANVTPKDIGDFTRISLIEASPHDAGSAYLAANRYGLDDLAPILYKTKDFGKTWTRIVSGIPATEFTRAIREDPERKGLLYAGTERGVWISFDDGANWQSLRLNLPIVPVHDLAVKDGDLIAATHGRAFWILDDLSALRQMSPSAASATAHLFKPRDAYRVSWGGGGGGGTVHPTGKNPPSGAVVYYALKNPNQEVTLDFLDAKGAVIRSFSSKLDSQGLADSVRADSVRRARADSLKAIGQLPVTPNPETPSGEVSDAEDGAPRGPSTPRVPNKFGLNTFVWDLRYPDAVRFTNLILWSGSTTGPFAPPGTYAVRMTTGGQTETQSLRLLKDPRLVATQAELVAQFDLQMKIRDRLSEANNAVRTVRNVEGQLADRARQIPAPLASRYADASKDLSTKITATETEIYQVKNQSSQDPLNFPIKLNNKIAALGGVASGANGRPTAQSYQVYDMLSTALTQQLTKLNTEMTAGLVKVNAILSEAKLPPIVPATAETPVKPKVISE